jgi:hypothetical protein
LSFDNTLGAATGVALANTTTVAANIGVFFRDDTGATLFSTTLSIPALGHTSFVLASSYPVTAGKRGSLEFDGTAGQISVLGIRANSTGAFSSIPALTK